MYSIIIYCLYLFSFWDYNWCITNNIITKYNESKMDVMKSKRTHAILRMRRKPVN